MIEDNIAPMFPFAVGMDTAVADILRQSPRDGRRIMEAILCRIDARGRNPVRFPAVALRRMLGLEGIKDWRSRVERSLEDLRARQLRVQGFRTCLRAWWYVGEARGAGHYFLLVRPEFIPGEEVSND